MNTVLKFIILLLILLTGSVQFVGCAGGETAFVAIHLGLDEHAAGRQRSILDSMIAFLSLSRNAEAAPPDNITGIDLYITGPGMVTEHISYAPSTRRIEVAAPSGKNRTFTVVARIDPADPRAVLAYGGSATVDLLPGENVTLSIRMVTYETKLVIPDGWNNRVVQIDDITGAGWTTYSTSLIAPCDIAFDARGRIIIAAPSTGLVRIDGIGGQNRYTDSTGSYPRYVATDMVRDLVYSAANVTLYRYQGELETGSKTSLSVPWQVSNIRGIAVHADGTLFLAGTYDPDGAGIGQPPRAAIVHYDPVSQTEIANNYGDTNLTNFLQHIMLKDGLVHAIHSDGGFSVNEIMIFDNELNFIDKEGSAAGDLGTRVTAPMSFFFPARFVAILNRRITLIDDDYAGSNHHDRLVQFSNLDGADWSIYGDYGSGIGFFSFYS